MRTAVLATSMLLFPICAALAAADDERRALPSRLSPAAIQTASNDYPTNGHIAAPSDVSTASTFVLRRDEPILIPYDQKDAKTETPLWDLDN